jgi:UDP-N-acetyl-D-glucosamine dehydrogenase
LDSSDTFHDATVVVVGQGYVGLPLALAAAGSGYRVVGLDSDVAKVDSIKDCAIALPGVSAAQLRDLQSRALYSPSVDYKDAKGFNVALLTLPTPLNGKVPDLSYLVDATTRLAAYLQPGSLVIVESTTFPGTTREVIVPILEDKSKLVAGSDFYLAYSPERINPGDPDWGLHNTPKIVSGLTTECRAKAEEFYQSLAISTVPVSSLENAEFTKLLENSFRLVNISLINELSTVTRDLGVDLWECLDAADTKPFGFTKFSPGPGVGGHCLPVDPVYLSWAATQKSGRSLRTIDTAVDINGLMSRFIADRIASMLRQRGKDVRRSTVLLLGIAYKAGVGDPRESPALSLASELGASGASVVALDNQVSSSSWPENITRIERGPFDEIDLAVVLTAHGQGDWEALLDSPVPILDTRNYVNGTNVEQLAA